MSTEPQKCTVCQTELVPKFRFQVQRTATTTNYYCSQPCHEQALFGQRQQSCSTCGSRFEPRFAFQLAFVGGEKKYFCTPECRENPVRQELRVKKGARKSAVMENANITLLGASSLVNQL